ncbi:hypothetical protein M422DRAFT_258986 [Sphaerobolus stellatus SS14]|uniref:Uncharacterized protein n=1 Tax=Sphaerobolus stellatus (strain SS14) TaxID=990650 RepID=A0A0C9U5T3_SPHS4|nr:hypothetical protein M422DRAFT_258986 [Sphaerobolus stellatus SS14]
MLPLEHPDEPHATAHGSQTGPRQDKNQTDKASEHIKSLREEHDCVEMLENIKEDLSSAQIALERTTKDLQATEKVLGLSGAEAKACLKALKGNEFLRHHMNARALKNRIRLKLISQKFEQQWLEHAYQEKDHTQTKALPKGGTKSISVLVPKYNHLVELMRDLKQHTKAPAHARLPPLLKPQKLFRLDVDDDIWNDDGLGDDDAESPPRWLAGQDVRDGIVALLIKDWGLEEMERIKAEEANAMFWLRYEVMWVQRAVLNSQNNPPLSYQFETHLHDLWILNEHWQKHMDCEGKRKWLWMTARDFGGAAPPKVYPVDEEDVLGDLCDQMEGDLLGSDGEVDVIDDTDELSSSVDGVDEEMDVVRSPVLPTFSGPIMTESSSMLPSSALATSINASALSLVVNPPPNPAAVIILQPRPKPKPRSVKRPTYK